MEHLVDMIQFTARVNSIVYCSYIEPHPMYVIYVNKLTTTTTTVKKPILIYTTKLLKKRR